MLTIRPPEWLLIKDFVESNRLPGQYFSEIPVGSQKSVDLICLESNVKIRAGVKGPWKVPQPKNQPIIPLNESGIRKIEKDNPGIAIQLIEAKVHLNYEAIGQILCYKYLFARDYPSFIIKGCSVVYRDTGRDSSSDLLDLCKEHSIEVFKIE
ncbi:MAG: hypothetical protein PHU23_06845 [Dehalococcoidales bacterium]|nr:hypothetical protein [Dehalococcoidales bacterium]